ncbi:hypothetical protein LJ655_29940 [Paraburkholderia sp. MMS20-SJTN17]|uniref:Uncharacterized protein n=1 Tax=Paraburkholderia translucens TaxID=2886945 RepID=A0ABS8KNS9_9BURK|nr:hypothetical protein [Paraburkholderia sp. MMS20-SJTN17]MCC8406017.1 hypothetical protein [Paraburkholderia sp. MMS20-SJTN17]
MTAHSFNIELASTYGIHEAILIRNLQFWIRLNRKKGSHFHENHTWTYNSVETFAGLYPYLSPKKIRRALQNLVDKGVLLKGNFNRIRFDRSLWYAFVDEGRFLDDPRFLDDLDAPGSHLPARENALATPNKSHSAAVPNTSSRVGKSLYRTDVNSDINADEQSSMPPELTMAHLEQLRAFLPKLSSTGSVLWAFRVMERQQDGGALPFDVVKRATDAILSPLGRQTIAACPDLARQEDLQAIYHKLAENRG